MDPYESMLAAASNGFDRCCQLNRYDVRDFAKPVSSKGLSIHEINISPQEMEMYIDLEPFVNPTPYIVPEDMSLAKVRYCTLNRNCLFN